MIEAWRAPSCGRTKKSVVLGFGLHNNQTTGEMKTACTLLVLSMVILGTMYRVITATILLVLQVIEQKKYIIRHSILEWKYASKQM